MWFGPTEEAAAGSWEWEHRSDRDHLMPILRFGIGSTEVLVSIAAGETHSLGLTAANDVCRGDNERGGANCVAYKR